MDSKPVVIYSSGRSKVMKKKSTSTCKLADSELDKATKIRRPNCVSVDVHIEKELLNTRIKYRYLLAVPYKVNIAGMSYVVDMFFGDVSVKKKSECPTTYRLPKTIQDVMENLEYTEDSKGKCTWICKGDACSKSQAQRDIEGAFIHNMTKTRGRQGIHRLLSTLLKDSTFHVYNLNGSSHFGPYAREIVFNYFPLPLADPIISSLSDNSLVTTPEKLAEVPSRSDITETKTVLPDVVVANVCTDEVKLVVSVESSITISRRQNDQLKYKMLALMCCSTRIHGLLMCPNQANVFSASTSLGKLTLTKRCYVFKRNFKSDFTSMCLDLDKLLHENC